MTTEESQNTKKSEERLEGESSSDEEYAPLGIATAGGSTTTPAKEDSMKFSCDIVRRNATMLLATEEMTLAEFLHAIGDIPEDDYIAFMALRGKEKGKDNPFYPAAHAFFEERERKEREERKLLTQQSQRQGKKRKSEAIEASELVLPESTFPQTITSIATASTLSPAASTPAPTTTSKSAKKEWVRPQIDVLIDQVNQVTLPDNDRVYDDCDEIRRKIAVFVEEEAGSITKFSFAVKTTPSVINRFLARKGKDQGAGSEVYKRSYFFFEKLRVLRDEPKSKHRLQSEREYPDGYPLKNPKGEK